MSMRMIAADTEAETRADAVSGARRAVDHRFGRVELADARKPRARSNSMRFIARSMKAAA